MLDNGYSPPLQPPTMSSFYTNELSLALLNAAVNGSAGLNPAAALDAIRSRTEENAIGVCGFPCMGDCSTCTQSERDLQAFYAPEAPPAPPAEEPIVSTVVLASATVEGSSSSTESDETWEELQIAARARDEADEAARTGIWADTGEDYDGPDRADPADDDVEDDYDPYYDDRDDRDGYDDGYGLDWNESGYFD